MKRQYLFLEFSLLPRERGGESCGTDRRLNGLVHHKRNNGVVRVVRKGEILAIGGKVGKYRLGRNPLSFLFPVANTVLHSGKTFFDGSSGQREKEEEENDKEQRTPHPTIKLKTKGDKGSPEYYSSWM